MIADSPHVTRTEPSLGFRRGVYEPRHRDPVAVVVHTTGGGPLRRFRDDKQRRRHGWGTPFDVALTIYGSMMEAGPHYVVGQGFGQIAQVAPEDVCAWHVGGRGGGAYKRASWTTRASRWWHERWPDFESPRELAGGHLWDPYTRRTGVRVALSSLAGSVNANTIGIEVVPPVAGARLEWSPAAWQNLARLVRDICKRHDEIPLAREHVLTHSDCHPRARSRRPPPEGQPWDPWPSQWSPSPLWRWLEIPLACGPA